MTAHTQARLEDTGCENALAALQAQFEAAPGYLNAATMGLAPRAVVEAMTHGVERWRLGTATAAGYDAFTAAARELYARLVGVQPTQVAIGSQTSVFVGMVASSLPEGSEVLCVHGDFTSVVYPFLVHEGRGVRTRHVPLEELADDVTTNTALVAFSLVQSADGRVADAAAVTSAARRVGALTLCDTTQALGWLPVDAGRYDMTVCAAYKWLCQPRGAAYLTVRPEVLDRLRPTNAGWYAGRDVWSSCYGPSMDLAPDARRFDVSPAWLSFVGAVPALEAFGAVPAETIHSHDVGLADALLAALDLPPGGSAIVSLPDPEGNAAQRLTAAGMTVASRAGRVRLAFHVWNDADDVARAAAALRPERRGAY